jgi:hypothetical protein
MRLGRTKFKRQRVNLAMIPVHRYVATRQTIEEYCSSQVMMHNKWVRQPNKRSLNFLSSPWLRVEPSFATILEFRSTARVLTNTLTRNLIFLPVPNEMFTGIGICASPPGQCDVHGTFLLVNDVRFDDDAGLLIM